MIKLYVVSARFKSFIVEKCGGWWQGSTQSKFIAAMSGLNLSMLALTIF